jgi:DNA-binding response OmpR family regulator
MASHACGAGRNVASVLVIEDEVSVRTIVRRILIESGHEVIEAATTDAGLAAARTMGVDMVVADICLEGQDGIGLMAEIRRSRPEVPLIVVSGQDQDEIQARLAAEELRRSVWLLAKPFLREQLLAAVREATLVRSPQRRALPG